MSQILLALRVCLWTLFAGCLAYPTVVLLFAHLCAPEAAAGSLVRDAQGRIRGSHLVAQAFASDRYFWPRPSACGWDGAAAAGSNLAPGSPALRARALASVASHRANAGRPLPADLAAASGSGLDPHITLAAARFQVPRVAAARGLAEPVVVALVEQHARAPAAPCRSRLVHVLELNLALDQMQ
jgi:K+-transporting ATPase ATPase C chain